MGALWVLRFEATPPDWTGSDYGKKYLLATAGKPPRCQEWPPYASKPM